MSSLDDLTQQYLDIFAKLDYLTDPKIPVQERAGVDNDTPEAAAAAVVETEIDALWNALESSEDSLAQKADAYGVVIKSFEHDIDSIKAEEDRLYRRRKSREGRVAWLKKNMGRALRSTGRKNIEGALHSFSVRDGAERVVVDDEMVLPQGTFTVKTEIVPDKRLIKERLKAGVETDGAHIERGDDIVTLR